MKKARKTGYLLVSVLFMLAVPFICTLLQTSEVSAAPKKYTGWEREGKRWYYYKKGAKQKGWLTLDGKKYFLSKKKYWRFTGLHKIGGFSYYFDSEGAEIF